MLDHAVYSEGKSGGAVMRQKRLVSLTIDRALDAAVVR